MPVVPFSPPVPTAPAAPPVDEPWALMAAAQMHAENRLIAPEEPTDDNPAE